jgi:hypothetical protein
MYKLIATQTNLTAPEREQLHDGSTGSWDHVRRRNQRALEEERRVYGGKREHWEEL